MPTPQPVGAVTPIHEVSLEVLNDLITNNLDLAYKSIEPTFVTINYKEDIDITAVRTRFLSCIEN